MRNRSAQNILPNNPDAMHGAEKPNPPLPYMPASPLPTLESTGGLLAFSLIFAGAKTVVGVAIKAPRLPDLGLGHIQRFGNLAHGKPLPQQ